jgi:hypothetical protein
VVEIGLNATLPEVAPPVLKLVPVQDKELDEDQVIVVVCPVYIELGEAEIFAVAGARVTVTFTLEVESDVPALEQVIV